MRWFRTFALLLLVLFLLLVAAPAFRWFQTRKPFVSSDPPASDFVDASVQAPKWILLPRVATGSDFQRGDPIGDYLALRQFMAQMEPLRIVGTDLYDLRPYLSQAGMKIPPEAVARWDPKSETALLKLPARDLEEARILVGSEFSEWDSRQMELRASVVGVDRPNAANFLSVEQDLTVEWLAALPPDSVRILHGISTNARSGQRSKAVYGNPLRRNSDAPENYVEFEVDPLLGPDNVTLDINFAYQCRLIGEEDPEKPLAFKVTTQVTLYTGHAMVFELGTGRDPDDGNLAAYYLVLQADVIGTLGTRSKNAETAP